MRTLILAVAIVLSVYQHRAIGGGPDDVQAIAFKFTGAELDAVLHFYSELAGRPVDVESGVGGVVDLMSRRPIKRAQVLPLIRKLLLEQYGIQIEDTPTKIRVFWSSEYPAEREAIQRTLKSTPPNRVIDGSKKD